MNLILVGLASAILLYTLPAPAWADGERGSAAESKRYAQREAETPQLDTFRGGCPGDMGPWLILLIPIALVVLPFYLLYEGCDALRGLICPEKPASAPKPAPEKEKAQPKKNLSRLLHQGVACA